jgi:hypothetical protein
MRRANDGSPVIATINCPAKSTYKAVSLPGNSFPNMERIHLGKIVSNMKAGIEVINMSRETSFESFFKTSNLPNAKASANRGIARLFIARIVILVKSRKRINTDICLAAHRVQYDMINCISVVKTLKKMFIKVD